MNLQDICEETVDDVEGCLGCAVVDLETGLPLAMEVAGGALVNQDAMELLAAASAEYFRGPMVWQLQLTVGAGERATDFVHEVQTTTEETYNFMSVVPERESTALVLILDKAANLGLGRISMRQVLRRLSESSDSATAGRPIESAEIPTATVAPVAMPSAFMRPPKGSDGAGPSQEAARPAHVPYRDVSASAELSGDVSQRRRNGGRQWRGVGGRAR